MEKKRISKKIWVSAVAVFAVVAISIGIFMIPSVQKTFWGQWEVTLQPTCEKEGQEQRTNIFGKTETRAVAALGHSFDVTTVAPDCVNDGYGIYSCERCATTYAADFIHADGHKFGEWKVTKAATCTENGAEEQVCSECQLTVRRVICAIGHKYVAEASGISTSQNSKYVCKNCNDTVVSETEEEISDGRGENLLFDVEPDFSFDIVSSENEEYIKANVKIFDVYFEDTEYEEHEDIIRQFDLTKKSDNVWTISPSSVYDYQTSYKVELTGNVKFDSYKGEHIIFTVKADENHVDVYEEKEGIIYLKQYEQTSPGYYPYTLTPTDNGEHLNLILNKADDLEKGNIICVGDVCGFDEIQNDPDCCFGKIKSIQKLESGQYLVVLEAPQLGEIFSALDISVNDTVDLGSVEIDEEKIGAELVNALYGNEDYQRFLGTVNLAARSYAEENGYDSSEIRNIASFMDKIKITSNVSVDGTKLNASLKGEIKIPLKNKAGAELGDISVSFTVKIESEFQFRLCLELKTWAFIPTGVDYFDVSITQTDVYDFNFEVEMNVDYEKETSLFYEHKTSKIIHRQGCTHITNGGYQQNYNELTSNQASKKLKEDPTKECMQCRPRSGIDSDTLVLNTSKKIIHTSECYYTRMLAEKNREESKEKAAYWMAKGYTCCDHCHPDNRKDLDFKDKMLDSLGYTDWSQTVTDISQWAKDAGISEASQKGIVLAHIPIYFGVGSVNIDVSFVMSFELEATFSYEYSFQTENTYGFRYQYNCAAPYFTKTNEIVKNELNLMGKAKLKLGVEVRAYATITGLSQWMYVDISAQAGAYASLSGIVHHSFVSDESFAAAYLEAGIYLTVDCGYKFFDASNEYTLFDKEWALVKLGAEKAYYAYSSPVESLEIDSIYDLNGLLNVKYYDLTDLEGGTEKLSATNSSGDYTVSAELENGEHFWVENGKLIVNADAPCTATDVLILNVLSPDAAWGNYKKDKCVFYMNEYRVFVSAKTQNHNYIDGVCSLCSLDSADDENHTCQVSHLELVKPSTCSEEGVMNGYCSCGKLVQEQSLPKEPHPGYEWVIIKDSTCTSTGVRENRCTACGETLSEGVVDKKDHDLGDWVETKQATEEQEGAKKRTCNNCSYSVSAIIPKLPHTHKYLSAWKTNSTDHWKECACGNKSELSAHNYGSWDIITQATEEKEGLKRHTCLTCKYVESVVIPKLEHKHSYGDWKYNLTSHWKECRCTNTIEVFSHTYGEWVVTKPATEENEGSKYHVCTVCGYKETAVIDVIPHVHKYDQTQNNSTKHWKVCRCGDISDQAKHVYEDWQIITDSTCVSMGEKKHSCAVCRYTEKDVIDIKPHNYVITEVKPTRQSNGYTQHICADCSASYADNYTFLLYFDACQPSNASATVQNMPADVVCKADGTIVLPSQIPSLTGWTFGGWYKDKACTAKAGDPGGALSFTAGGSTCLYAKWTANTYDVVYNANGGSGSMSNSTFRFGETQKLQSNQFSRHGWVFIGWSTSPSATTPTYNNGASVSDLPADGSKRVVLYAVWSIITTNTYNEGNQSFDTGVLNKSFGYAEKLGDYFNIEDLVAQGYTKVEVYYSYGIKVNGDHLKTDSNGWYGNMLSNGYINNIDRMFYSSSTEKMDHNASRSFSYSGSTNISNICNNCDYVGITIWIHPWGGLDFINKGTISDITITVKFVK
ncbi:MAG: InlB B-repeat-containing protein [Clostridia bacterium]|nr:InlB B-repeat-containing protein [Clostridia bacterium]